MKILIGYDGSENADAIFDDLHRAGCPKVAEVVIASISEMWLPLPTSYGGVETSFADETITGEMQSGILAKKASERIRADFPEWNVGNGATVGSPSGVLLEKADEWKPDLMVLGSQGHTGVGRLLLGSVSQTILNQATCSVRIARPHDDDESGSGEPTRIVVGVDGSDESKSAVESIVNRNWAKGTEVRVICAMTRLLSVSAQDFDIKFLSKLEDTEYFRTEKSMAMSVVSNSVQILEDAGFEVSSLIATEDPKKLLVSEALEWNAHCIVVGSRGLSRLKRLLIGSVASAVAARAHCSVEVVRR